MLWCVQKAEAYLEPVPERPNALSAPPGTDARRGKTEPEMGVSNGRDVPGSRCSGAGGKRRRTWRVRRALAPVPERERPVQIAVRGAHLGFKKYEIPLLRDFALADVRPDLFSGYRGCMVR